MMQTLMADLRMMRDGSREVVGVGVVVRDPSKEIAAIQFQADALARVLIPRSNAIFAFKLR